MKVQRKPFLGGQKLSRLPSRGGVGGRLIPNSRPTPGEVPPRISALNNSRHCSVEAAFLKHYCSRTLHILHGVSIYCSLFTELTDLELLKL